MNKKFVKKCCCEDISLIENYEKAVNDKNQIWDLHHKLEIELEKTANDLISIGLYYNRPASELIFLTHKEHTQLHQSQNYMKQIISNNCSGEKNGMYNKNHTKETKEKISKKRKERKGFNHSEETKIKMSISARKPKQKYKWLTPDGKIVLMSVNPAHRYHPDWVLIE